MKKLSLAFLLCFFTLNFLCFFTLNSFAAALRLATGEYTPFTGEHIAGQGMATEVVKAVFKELDQDITIEFLPWNRITNNLKIGNFAGSFPWKVNDERREYLLYSEPLMKFRTLLFMRNDYDFSTKNISKKNFCIPDGWDPGPYAGFIKKYDIKLTKPMSLDSCMKMLSLKRVDLMFLNEFVGLEAIKKNFGSKSPLKGVETDLFPKDNYLYYVIPKKYREAEKLMAQFNTGLQKVKKNGVYNEILKKYKITREGAKSIYGPYNLLGLR